MVRIIATTVVWFVLLGGGLFASPTLAAAAEPIVVSLSRAGQPMTLEVSILSARMKVIGEDRSDVSVLVSGGESRRSIVTPSGTKPITRGSYRLEVTEEDNRVRIGSDWRMSAIDLEVRVPRAANLELSTTNDGNIVVENVGGDLQLRNINGPIRATGARGSVIAESINENVEILFADMANAEAVSMSSVNGDLIVGLPPRAAVELHLDTSRGGIASDFEIAVQPSEPVVTRRERGGSVEVQVENVIVATVNGGGPVVRLKTLNGDIQINEVGR